MLRRLLHHGALENCGDTYEGLIRWIDDSDLEMAAFSRELYLEWSPLVGEENAVTEIQFPVRRPAAAPAAAGSR